MVAAAIAAPAAMAKEAVSVTPREVAPGAEVTVTATGFPPWVAVELGAGPPASEYAVIDHGQTDGEGSVRFLVRLLDTAPVGVSLVFVVATEDLGIKAASEPIDIIAPLGVPVAHLKAVPGS